MISSSIFLHHFDLRNEPNRLYQQAPRHNPVAVGYKTLIRHYRACYNPALSGHPADRVEKKCTHSWNTTPPPGVPRPWSESAPTPARPTRQGYTVGQEKNGLEFRSRPFFFTAVDNQEAGDNLGWFSMPAMQEYKAAA